MWCVLFVVTGWGAPRGPAKLRPPGPQVSPPRDAWPGGAGDASPRGVMAMYPNVSSSKRRSATSVVAARRGEQRLPSHTRGAVLHGQHARNERRRRLPFAGAARPRRGQTQAHRREAALHAPRERGGCPEQSKQRGGCPCRTLRWPTQPRPSPPPRRRPTT